MPFSQKWHKAIPLLNFLGSSSSCSGGKRPSNADGQDHDGQLRRWPGWGEQAHRRGGRNLIILFWSSVLGFDVLHYRFHLHVSEAIGPREKMFQRVSIIFFSDAVYHGKSANYGKGHDRSGYQAENNCIRLKFSTISPKGRPDKKKL